MEATRQLATMEDPAHKSKKNIFISLFQFSTVTLLFLGISRGILLLDIPLLPIILTISGLIILFMLIGFYCFFWKKPADLHKYETPLTDFDRENPFEEEDLHTFTTHQMNRDYYRLM